MTEHGKSCSIISGTYVLDYLEELKKKSGIIDPQY